MSAADFPHSFRILGSISNRRMRVDAAVAFDAHRLCDTRARVDQESYLGVFQFGNDFAELLASKGSPGGFAGGTWSPYIWWDIDRDAEAGGVARAIEDTQRLIETLEMRFDVPCEYLLSCLSGGKGCHLGLPTALWLPDGGTSYHLVAREFAEKVAAEAAVTIDTGIYDRVRAFRSPNSRHPKTGLHKRFLPSQQFGALTIEDARAIAASPAPFELPDLSGVGVLPKLGSAWAAAVMAVEKRRVVFKERWQATAVGTAQVHVNRLTLDLIRGEKVAVGDRHRTIYSAARNLAEAGAPRHLISQLLREPALDTGLSPKDVDRQIECGFAAWAVVNNSAPDQGTDSLDGRVGQP